MNRAAKRKARRSALQFVRNDGCTCSPRFIDLPVHERPLGAVGGLISHAVGCVLGDRLLTKNRLGVLPTTLVVSGASEPVKPCDR